MFRQDFKDGVGHIEIEKIKTLSPNPAQIRREHKIDWWRVETAKLHNHFRTESASVP